MSRGESVKNELTGLALSRKHSALGRCLFQRGERGFDYK